MSSQHDAADTAATTEPNRSHHTDLTTFQVDTLTVTARLESAYEHVAGQQIKDGLEEIRDEEVNHGRLYPNLDDLAQSGLTEKQVRVIDDRTNSYRVTQRGFRMLDRRRDHLARALDGGA